MKEGRKEEREKGKRERDREWRRRSWVSDGERGAGRAKRAKGAGCWGVGGVKGVTYRRATGSSTVAGTEETRSQKQPP